MLKYVLIPTFKYYESGNRSIAEQQEKGALRSLLLLLLTHFESFSLLFFSSLLFSFQNPNEFLSEIYISVHSLELSIIPCSLIGLLEKEEKTHYNNKSATVTFPDLISKQYVNRQHFEK
uniref:Uncharacterized protein n=1 Tax=Glossina austeni TaxID=7395 RepID=A0A1A9VV50_GLOAU